MIMSENLVLRCFKALSSMDSGYCAQCHKLSSVQHALHLPIHAFPGTMQLQSMGITYLIGISYRKAVGNIDMQEKRLISARMDFVMLNFSFDFYTFL